MEITPYPKDPRYGVTKDGRVFRIVRARFGKPVPQEIKPTTNSKGYLMVGNGKNSGLYTIGVHRMMAETFLPNPDGLPEVAHEDGVKTHNVLGNLRWSSYADNQADRLRHGTHNRGTRQTNHKLTEEDVFALRTGAMSPDTAAALRGCGVVHARQVSRGKDWPHVQH